METFTSDRAKAEQEAARAKRDETLANVDELMARYERFMENSNLSYTEKRSLLSLAGANLKLGRDIEKYGVDNREVVRKFEKAFEYKP